MTAEATVQATIDNARTVANDSASLAASFSQSAQTAAVSGISLNIPRPTDPNVPRPVEAERPQDLSPLYEATFDSFISDKVDDLPARMRDYINEYFPDYDQLMSTVVNWLEDVIQNSTIGITPAYENAVWERERARELQEANRTKDNAVTDFATRGFSMPSGMLAARLQEVDQAAQNNSVTSARDQAIKHIELAVENVQFAIQQSIALQTSILNAAVNYINAYVRAITTGIDHAKTMVDAKNSLYQYAYEYYKTYIAWGEMALRYEQLNNNVDLTEAGLVVDFATKNVRSRVEAAVGAAEAMGDVAAAALASQNSMATIVHQTTTST